MRIPDKCDILFVPVLGFLGSGHLHFAALSMIGYIHKYSDFKADILDLKSKYFGHSFSQKEIDMFFDDIVNGIRDVRPKFVGFSSFTTDYNLVMRLSQYIKDRVSVAIVVGGVHSTLLSEDFIYKDSPIDIAVIGEGEATVLDILRLEVGGKAHRGIDGISFYDYEENEYIKTNQRSYIDDLDSIPRLAYEYLDMELYLRPRLGLIRWVPTSRGVGLYTGRGCPYVCTFCAANTIWEGDVSGSGKRLARYRSMDSVFEEIEYLKNNYDLRTLYIMDDSFALQKKRVLEFADRISEMNVLWAAETRCGLINDEIVQAMQRSGCIQLDFGVESGSQRMLDAMRKAQKVKDVEKAFDICHKQGMRTFANILINIPGETEVDIDMTDKVIKKIHPDELSVAVLTPYPGSPIFVEHVKKLEKDEYELLAFRDDPAARFRFSHHKLSFQEIQLRLFSDNIRLLPTAFRILANTNYLKYLRSSPDKYKLVKLIIKFGGPMTFRLIVHLVMPSFLKIRIRRILSARRLATKIKMKGSVEKGKA